MLVLETTRPVVDQAKFVSIDDAAIARWAAEVPQEALRTRGCGLMGHLPTSQAKLANLVLLIDALSFCFWSDDPIRFDWRGKTYQRFEAMFVSLMLAARFGPEWCDPAYWVKAPAEEIRQVLSGRGRLQMMEDRERIIRETGRTLIDRFEGQFINAVESVNHRAWPLAVLLMTNFDSFRDVGSYHGMPVYFMKRAQLCAANLACAWDTHEFPTLSGLEELAAFADDCLPRALRYLEILRLAAELADVIDQGAEVAQGCDEEVEIRAATIQAVERMRGAAAAAGKPAPAWQIAWYLWGLSHTDGIVVDHHRTWTVYY